MASLKFSFVFLLSLFTTQIQARDVKFFSKVSPSTATPATVKQEQEQEPSFMRETQNAYGLYGNQGSAQFPTTTKLAGDAIYTPATGESFSGDPNSSHYYNNEQFTDNEQNFGENNFKESNFKAQNNDNKQSNYYSYSGYKNGEMQGMSDTRFMENGNDNNYFPDQYQNSRDNYNYGNRAYNNENNFEFDNSMENFQNQNENDFPENEKYVP